MRHYERQEFYRGEELAIDAQAGVEPGPLPILFYRRPSPNEPSHRRGIGVSGG